MDLHVKFCTAGSAASERTCIVVVQVRGFSSAAIHLGLLVDDVEEVAQIAATDIEEAPEFGAEINTEYILGMAKLKSRVAILLDIDRVLQSDAAELPSAENNPA